MQTIPTSAVEDAWNAMQDEAAAQLHLDRFAKEQPVLMAFIMSAEEEVESADEQGFLLIYSLWIWLAFDLNGRDKSMVRESEIEAAYQANTKAMGELEAAGPNAVLRLSKQMTESYNQMPMLGAILAEVMEGELQETRNVDDMTGVVTLYIKTVIDSLDA